VHYLLTVGLAMSAPIAMVVTAPSAAADCKSQGYSTVCSQGEVRGPDGVARTATAGVPYPCDDDWYCGTDWDLDVDWNPGGPVWDPGRPGGIGPRR